MTLILWRALKADGYDVRSLFERAGLDPEALPRPGARYAIPAVKRLWALAMEVTGDPCLGIHVGRQWHPSAAHALGYAWLASGSLLESFQRLVRYFRLVTTDQEVVKFLAEPNGYQFLWDDSQSYYGISDVEYDESFAAIVTLCRLNTGDHLAPLLVRMRRGPPPCESEFTAFFRSPVEYSAGENSILFDARDVEAALPSSNIQIARECDRIIDRYLAEIERDNVAAGTKAQLLLQLPSGSVTEESVAKALHLSVRTLQRRLAEEQLTFKHVLDETRRELAMQYIRDPAVSINEMTYLLGYSEPANFSRAFKRWTGQSPSTMRAA